MSLKFVLLSTLQNEIKTGYDIAKEYDISRGNFWQATHQQIYRELNKLLTQELISVNVEKQSGKPDKKLYQITNTGKETLIAWLQEPSDEKLINSPLLAKFMAGEFSNPEALLKDVKIHQKKHQEKLHILTSIEKEQFSSIDYLPDHIKLIYLCLRRGVLAETMWLAWADEVIPHLESMTS